MTTLDDELKDAVNKHPCEGLASHTGKLPLGPQTDCKDRSQPISTWCLPCIGRTATTYIGRLRWSIEQALEADLDDKEATVIAYDECKHLNRVLRWDPIKHAKKLRDQTPSLTGLPTLRGKLEGKKP